MNKDTNIMEKIVSLCKRRGFIFQGSEIYGGLAGTFDYGHTDSLLKEILKILGAKDLCRTEKICMKLMLIYS